MSTISCYVVISLDLQSTDPGIERVWGPWDTSEEANDYAEYLEDHTVWAKRGVTVHVSQVQHYSNPETDAWTI